MRMMIGLVLGALVVSGTAAAQARRNPLLRPRTPRLRPRQLRRRRRRDNPPQRPPRRLQLPVPFPADAKVGFVDMQYVISESKLGKAGMEKIQALSAKQNAERTPAHARKSRSSSRSSRPAPRC